MPKGVSKLFSEKIKAAFLILIGSLSWSSTMIKNGLVYSYGLGFWGANGHDGIWHVALAESLSHGSFQMPVFAGLPLQNYHIGFDLILAVIHNLTGIPIVNLYFQALPPILAVLVGILSYKFVFDWTRSEKSALWSTFFVYFGGGFGFLLGKGESTFWSTQAVSTLINPPFTLSLIIILLGLTFILRRKLFWATVCFGILIEIKAYAGILVLGALAMSGAYRLFKERKVDLVFLFFGSLVLSLILYLPLSKNSAGLLVLQPFWFLETMIGLSDRVGWSKFYSAMTSYKLGHIWLKAIPAYLVAFAIFYLGNLGTRIVKELLFWKWIKNIKNFSWIEVFMGSLVVAGVLIPMFFLQEGTPWNTIQFFYYSLFFSAILAGASMTEIVRYVKSTSIIRVVEVGVVLLTIPTTIFTLKDVYLPSRPPAKLSNEELAALNFLRRQSGGVVLTYPFDAVAAKEAESRPPRPLYLYTSTAYVSAFSAHPTFLEDEVNLDITGYDWRGRLAEVEAWYKENNQKEAREFLENAGIKYVYWLKPQRALLGEGQLGLKNIFENPSVVIYQVE